DYEAWYLRDTASGAFLRGESHWWDVEGALLRFVLTQMLPALGLLNRGATGPDRPMTAFKPSRWASNLLAGEAPADMTAEDGLLTATAGLQIDVPRHVPRAVRYQIARFSEWQGLRRGGYRY